MEYQIKNLKYKLYQNKKNRKLHGDINLAWEIYTHALALHKRYFRLFKRHLKLYTLQKHLTKLKKLSRYKHWKKLNSQTIQEIAQRIEKGYLLFFKEVKNKRISPPRFRKRSKYTSITFKQTGFKYLGENRVKIGRDIYRFFLSRPVEGLIKGMTVKRDSLGDFYVCFTVEVKESEKRKVASGKIVGFDFGLSTFLTASDYNDIKSPRFLQKEIKYLKKLSRALSKKKKGSNNRKKARRNLARRHIAIANRRRDWFFKLAHRLASYYKLLCFEDLNMKGMMRLWGRKVSDYAFSEFISILKYVAKQYDGILYFCDRYFPSSKTCCICDWYNKDLQLKQVAWECKQCKSYLDRNRSASYTVLRAGASAHGLGDVRPKVSAVTV